MERHRAVDLVRHGATFQAAGEAVGVSDFAVRKWCKADGVVSVRSRARGDNPGGIVEPADAADTASQAALAEEPAEVPDSAEGAGSGTLDDGRYGKAPAAHKASVAKPGRRGEGAEEAALVAAAARVAEAERRIVAAEKRAAVAELRLRAMLAAHPGRLR